MRKLTVDISINSRRTIGLGGQNARSKELSHLFHYCVRPKLQRKCIEEKQEQEEARALCESPDSGFERASDSATVSDFFSTIPHMDDATYIDLEQALGDTPAFRSPHPSPRFRKRRISFQIAASRQRTQRTTCRASHRKGETSTTWNRCRRTRIRLYLGNLEFPRRSHRSQRVYSGNEVRRNSRKRT